MLNIGKKYKMIFQLGTIYQNILFFNEINYRLLNIVNC